MGGELCTLFSSQRDDVTEGTRQHTYRNHERDCRSSRALFRAGGVLVDSSVSVSFFWCVCVLG